MNTIEKAVKRLNQRWGSAYNQEAEISSSITENDKISKPQFVPETKAKLQLNFNALVREGYLTPDTTRGDMAEAYRHLKRAVLMNAKGNDDVQIPYGNLILITSALPEEGKTFTAFNLAISITLERNNTVLLIDSDLTRRSLSNLVGLSDAPGLTDVLLNSQIELSDIIVNTNVPKLKLIPAGQSHPEATELLASEQMQAVACELSARYSDRIILFDGPPLLPTSQAILLATLMGQILVVVEEGKNSKAVIQEAVSLLSTDKVIGMVLNRCQRSFGNKEYRYYY